MAVDYNLIVIGSSLAGIEAAKTAASYHARVALVQQDEGWDALPACLMLLRDLAMPTPALQACGLFEHERVNWPKVAEYFQLLTAQQQAQYSFDRLTYLGIDVIPSSGAFRRKPRFGFEIEGRSLSATAYLIAGSIRQDEMPKVFAGVGLAAGLESVNSASIATCSIATLPQRLAQLAGVQTLLVMGGGAEEVAIAQALAKLGIAVTLVVSQLLPGLDDAVVKLLQAQLEADGVKILSGWAVETAKNQGRQVYLQMTQGHDKRELVVDMLLLGTEKVGLDQQRLDNMNLAAAKIRYKRDRIYCDRHHRATRKVYICGQPSIEQNAAIWIQSGQNAVDHILKLPFRSVQSHVACQIVISHPNLVAIGLTETMAQKRYGSAIQICQTPIYPNLKAQLRGQTSGLCKLVIHPKGQIIGAHILGLEAEEWGSPIALAMQQGMTIEQLANGVLPSPSLAEILVTMARDYRQQKGRSGWQQYALEEFFSWQRYWGK